jgi:DNA replicative helicase MCM subunit Mcm2 (Cdc46/Mcm family)
MYGNDVNLTFYLKSNFIKFFESNTHFLKSGYFLKKSYRIPIKMDKLWEFDPFLAKNLLENPILCFQIFKEALNYVFRKSSIVEKMEKKFFVPDIIGPFGKKICSINSLKAQFLGELVYTSGIVQKVGEKRIKIEKLVHYSNLSNKFFVHDYKKEKEDIFFQINKEDECYSSEIEYGLSNFSDWQSIILESFPAHNNTDCIFPKSLIAILENDLVDFCRKKDEIEICGIFRPFYNSISLKSSSIFSPILSVLSVKKRYKKDKIDPDQFDYFLMKNFSLLVNSFEKLSKLILPKISGQKNIKKGFLLFLASGNGPTKKDEVFTSEKIHLLVSVRENLIKNEYFKFISKIFPSSIFLRHEIFEKEEIKFKNRKIEKKLNEELVKNPLEFDKNIICIDQVEGLPEREKFLLKEILEQKSISVFKNKTKISVNSNSSIFATTGIFPEEFPQDKILDKYPELPTYLSNRFDLTLFIRDKFSIYEDKKMTNILLERHHVFCPFSREKTSKNKEWIKKKTRRFDGKEKKGRGRENKEKISTNFLKIYINFSKKNLKPVISGEASDTLLNFYQVCFLSSKNKNLPNIRKLESVIKLTISFTKLQLRSVVLRKDVKKIINYWKGITKNDHNILKNFQSNDLNRKPKNFRPENRLKNTIKKENKTIIKEVDVKMNNFWNFSIKKIKNISSDFLKIKKNLISRRSCSYFERLVFAWLAKKICFIFNKNIVKI